MYSNNKSKFKSKYLEKMQIKASLRDMVRSGEANLGFLIESMLSVYPHISYSKMKLWTLESIMDNQCN